MYGKDNPLAVPNSAEESPLFEEAINISGHLQSYRRRKVIVATLWAINFLRTMYVRRPAITQLLPAGVEIVAVFPSAALQGFGGNGPSVLR